MSSLLHRTDASIVTDSPHLETPEAARATQPSPPTPGHHAPWPMRAKVLVAILVAAAVLGAVGTTLGLMAGDNGSTERELRETVAVLTQQRSEALATVQELDVELAAVRLQLQAAEVGNDDLSDRAGELEAQLATLTEQRADALASVADLEATVESLQAAVTASNQSAAAAIASRDALAALFPMTLDVSLGADDVIGVYDVSLQQFHCVGLASCGTTRTLADLTIRSTPQGLRFAIPGFAEAGLLPANGAFHTIIDTNTALPACDGAPRTARVVMTVFPGTTEIAIDTPPELVDLIGIVTIEADATGSCPAALAAYSAEFTPHA